MYTIDTHGNKVAFGFSDEKRSYMLLIFVLAVLLALGGGWWWMRRRRARTEALGYPIA